MNKERIAHVIGLLTNSIMAESWDYGTWAEDFDKDEEAGTALPSCGTTACAAGWMGLNAKCNAEGFYLTKLGIPAYKEHRQTSAVCAYLDITYDDASGIFIDLHESLGENEDGEPLRAEDVTPAHVAQALQDLLNRG